MMEHYKQKWFLWLKSARKSYTTWLHMIDSSYGKAGFSDGLAVSCAWDTPHLNIKMETYFKILNQAI